MNIVIKAHSLSQCMQAMAEKAAEFEKAGGKNLIFCEDRLTLIAERALLKKLGGSFSTSVSTFARFLNEDEKIISKQGSVMAVGEVMTKLQRDNALQCFTTTTGIGNNARCIYETLAQLSASMVAPEKLRESLAELPENMLKRKVSDIAAIYEGYKSFLETNKVLDESKYLALLPSKIAADKEMAKTNVFFLCYTSFTKQASETVLSAIKNAANVVGVFCGGEEEIYTNRAYNTFVSLCRMHTRENTIQRGAPLHGEAELLRKGLFNPIKCEKRTITDKIYLYEAQDKTSEADFVATKIRRELYENPTMRNRDVAVLVPNVGEYCLPLTKSLAEYGIPVYIDIKKSLKNHPISGFILDCFRVVREKFSASSVQSLTQNYFFGESDEYRNYLLKFANYRWGAKREIKTGDAVEKLFDIDVLNDGRNRVLLATENIKERGHGRGYCQAIEKILEGFQTKNRLETLWADVDDVSQKDYLLQGYSAFKRVVDEAMDLLGTREMTVAEFEAVLKDGLDAMEISTIPLKSDAVFVGDITDSRIENVKVLFAVGMTDEVPRCANDTAIISDKEIDQLAAVKAELEPKIAEVNLRSRESLALNLCAFTDKLYLSYPLSADGSEPSISEVFRYINTIFCQGKDVEKNKDNLLCVHKKLEIDDFQYRCATPTLALRQLLINDNRYKQGTGEQRIEAQKYHSSIFSSLDKFGLQKEKDYLPKQGGQVCVENGEELFFANEKISPTSLECYFACPFKHFAEKGLGVKEREETAVLSVDTGNFVHDLLKETMRKSAEIKTEEKMYEYATEIGTKLLQKSVYTMQQDKESGVVANEKLLKEGIDVAMAAYRQIKGSQFKVELLEQKVVGDYFEGKVDRVDCSDKYVRVIDYKTGTIDDTANSYYTGCKLQLQLYMSAVKGERIPAGVFYFPASIQYADEDVGRFRMQGFMNGEEEALKCGDVNITETEKSEYFPSALKNSAATRRVMDEETFCNFLDYADLVAKQGYAELKEGNITPSPYDDECKYCKFGGMCGFDKDVDGTRKEDTIYPKEIAEIAQEFGKEKEE